MNPTLRRVVFPAIALACYLASFFLPALYLNGQANTNGQTTSMVGLAAFFDGFWGLFDRQYAWLANPLGGLAMILLVRRGRVGQDWGSGSRVGDAVAAGLALGAILIAQHTWVLVGSPIWGDEGGVTKYLVTSLGPGFFLWCGSFLLLAIAALIRVARPLPPPLPD